MSSPAMDESESNSSVIDIVVARCSDARNAIDDSERKKLAEFELTMAGGGEGGGRREAGADDAAKLKEKKMTGGGGRGSSTLVFGKGIKVPVGDNYKSSKPKSEKDNDTNNNTATSPVPKTDLKSYWSGGGEADNVPGPPSPTLARQSGVSQRASHPGVVSVGGMMPGDDNNTPTVYEPPREEEALPPSPRPQQEEEDTPSPALRVTADVRLAVADPVDEEADERQRDGLPTAHHFDGRQQQEKTDRLKTRILLGAPILLVVAIIVILVVVFAVPDDDDNNNNNKKENDGGGTGMATVAPSSSSTVTGPIAPPSSAPSLSPEGRVMSLLPDYTLAALANNDDSEEEESSPQMDAYRWLLQDLELGGEESSLPDERLRQRYALATLYYALDGDKWATNDGWLNHDLHECDWAIKTSFALEAILSGLYPGFLQEFTPLRNAPPCNRNGLFLHLWLDANKLEGSLPEELYMLTSLKSLSLGLDQIHGTLSSRISLLSNLEGLKISDLKGDEGAPIPSEIGLLTNLVVLGLLNNNHQGTYPPELWQLTNLETIFTGTNPKLGGTIPPQISNLRKLRWLSLDGGALTGSIPTQLGGLEYLEFVLLLQNQLSGPVPSEVGQLSKLYIFSVYENVMAGNLPTQVGLMTSLSWLSFRSNQFSGQIPSQLGLLSNLAVSLNLDNQMLTGTLPTQLGRLTALKKLEFANNQLTGPIPSQFGELAAMGKLTMSNNSLSGTLPLELEAIQQSLHTFSLDGNPNLSGIIPSALCTPNGTCSGIPMELNPCVAEQGIFFDCTNLLCGCNCSCSAAT